MDRFDFVIIGAGPAGEAAANEALRLGATAAVVDRDLFGGQCPFWACMPSKSLLHSAAIRALGGDRKRNAVQNVDRSRRARQCQAHIFDLDRRRAHLLVCQCHQGGFAHSGFRR